VQIKQIEQESESLFIAIENGMEAGRICYSWSAKGALIINHTEVHPEFKGKGIGNKLVFFVVEFARKNNITIVPVCDFAKSIFDKTHHLRDVL